MVQSRQYQPPLLRYLFLTEMWERFGYYVVQGLMVLYLTESFGFSDAESYRISGLFTALVYISPFFGGVVADRYLGFQQCIVFGGLLLIAGYALLAIPLHAGIYFYPALSFIVIGNGLFKPNISSLLGTQYEYNDPRRDAGFTYFYIGINLGATLAALSSGYIKDLVGWYASFALASIGLLIGLITFVRGFQYMTKTHALMRPREGLVFAFCLLVALSGITAIFFYDNIAAYLLPSAFVVLLVFMGLLIYLQKQVYRIRMILLSLLILSSIVFWTLFLQIFFSANLFVERLVAKELFGVPLSTTIFYGFESLFVILLGPLYAWSWQSLSHHQYGISPLLKFVIGMALVGLGFVILSLATHAPSAAWLVAPLWVIGAYLLITMGELFISPIGLAAVTLLSPKKLTGMMMGIWFMGNGFGGYFAGKLAYLASVSADISAPSLKLAVYRDAFLHYAYLAFFVSALLFVLHLLFKNRLAGVSDE